MIDEGDIRCIGTTQFLRNTYVAGTSLEIAFIKHKDLKAFSKFLDDNNIDYDNNQIKSDKTCYIIKDNARVSEVLGKLENCNLVEEFNIRA